MSSVLARPGAPTIRLLPPTKSVIRTWPITSSCPMITFFNSSTIACRPFFMRSASARSSGDARSTTSVITGLTVLSIGSPRTPNFQPPTPKEPVALGSWELGVGNLRFGSFQRSDPLANGRDLPQQAQKFGFVFRRRHAVLQDPQLLDTPFLVDALLVERAHLRVHRQRVGGQSERHDRGDPAVGADFAVLPG